MPPPSVRDRPDRSLRRFRLEQRCAPGEVVLVTLCTLYRRPVFEDEHAARAVCRVHTAHWPWRDSRVHAWVLLPDQWQCLLTLGERDSLSTLLGRFKALTSRAVEDRHRINGWLWGRGFGDRRLGPGESAEAAARQLVLAPVRAGLVARPGDYAYWNSAWLPPGEP